MLARAVFLIQGGKKNHPIALTESGLSSSKRSPALRWIFALSSILLVHQPAVAQSSADDFYRNKTISVVIGMSAGNTYDFVGRTIAKHIPKYIAGNPTAIPVNKPGAGSLVAANTIFNQSPRDGTVIGLFNRSIPTGPLLGTSPGAKFETTKFNWIGNVGDEVSVCVTRAETGVRNWNELISKPMSFAATSMSADTGVFSALLNRLFGAHLKIVTGYPGGGEITTAIERGEVDGRCGWSLGGIQSARPQWLKDKTINIPIQLALTASPELPNVPLILDQARNDNERRLLRLIFSRQEIAYPLAAPPDTPKERVKILRTAFNRMVKDPEFLNEAKKLAIPVSPISGEELQKRMASIYETPAALVAQARQLVGRK